MRLYTSNAIFYIPILIIGLYMMGYALADYFDVLSEKRRLKCAPVAYLLMGAGIVVVVIARIVDQAYPFQGDSLAIVAGMVCIGWGAVVQRRERIDRRARGP